MEQKGMILRIERLSLADGHGMRTVVFFKGCSLRCAWCSTPESQSGAREVYYMRERCVGCGACIPACPEGALRFGEDGQSAKIVRDNGRCRQCFRCVDACNYRAQQIYGREMTIKQVMNEIQKDELFFFYSGGGVTLSGGDIFCQTEFARSLLDACQDACINTAAELDLFTTYENVKRIVPLLDMVYVDLKCMNPEKHKKWTGRDNAQILENVKRADEICRRRALHIRVPLVEGVNDDEENICATARFCMELQNCCELEFLPYHRLGLHAYRQLGRPYLLEEKAAMNRFDVYQKMGFLCEETFPFDIRISGMEVYRAGTGKVPVTEEELKA